MKRHLGVKHSLATANPQLCRAWFLSMCGTHCLRDSDVMRVGGGVPTFFLCLLEEEEEEARGRVCLKRLSDLRFMHMHGTWLSYSGQLLAIATEGIAELTDPWPRITNMCGCFQCPSGVLTGSHTLESGV